MNKNNAIILCTLEHLSEIILHAFPGKYNILARQMRNSTLVFRMGNRVKNNPTPQHHWKIIDEGTRWSWQVNFMWHFSVAFGVRISSIPPWRWKPKPLSLPQAIKMVMQCITKLLPLFSFPFVASPYMYHFLYLHKPTWVKLCSISD